jgi:hypothetical protein
MTKLGSIATAFAMVAAFASAQTWTGRLVDAVCKASNEGQDSFSASCAASKETHLFAIELSDGKVLNLNAAGNEKAAGAIKDLQKADLRATVSGSLEEQMVKVETIEIQ